MSSGNYFDLEWFGIDLLLLWRKYGSQFKYSLAVSTRKGDEMTKVRSLLVRPKSMVFSRYSELVQSTRQRIWIAYAQFMDLG